MIRSGRDVLTSKHPNKPGYYIELERWMKDTNLTLELADESSFGDVLLVPYEGLINDLEFSVKRICKFLDLSFDPAMLDFPKMSSVKNHGAFHGGKVEGIYRTSSMRWKNSQHRERVLLIEGNREAKELLERVDRKIKETIR